MNIYEAFLYLIVAATLVVFPIFKVYLIFCALEHQPPYYAVIFTSTQTSITSGYSETADRMETLAKEQPGYLGMDHARSEMGITISYWKTLEDIAQWKAQKEHLKAQQRGITEWYEHYTVQICKVERVYSFDRK